MFRSCYFHSCFFEIKTASVGGYFICLFGHVEELGLLLDLAYLELVWMKHK